MSDVRGNAAPGWYPDPQGAAPLRWWDGWQWTPHVSQPAYGATPAYGVAPATRQQIAPETPVNTVWIWLVVLLPLLNLLMLPLLRPDVAGFLPGTGTSTAHVSPFALVGGPVYLLFVFLTWVVAALSIVFSWLDSRELTRRGVQRPFHWAWSFLGPLVYVIGRTVIVRGVAQHRGMAPLWTLIAVTVVSWIATAVWLVTLFSLIFQDAAHYAMTTA